MAVPTLLPDRPAPAAGGADTTAGRLEPFFGPHQAGITTGRQSHPAFAAFTLRPGLRVDEARRMMHLVSDDAARLTAAEPALGDQEPELARHPARLTVTFGFGPDLFAKLGLADRRPAGLADVPAYAIDRLQDRWSGGDLLAQIGADEPMVVAHALRQLTKTLRSCAARRWVQRGFTATPGGGVGSSDRPPPVRNLKGLVDGSSNPRLDDPDFDTVVWATGRRRGSPAGATWCCAGRP